MPTRRMPSAHIRPSLGEHDLDANIHQPAHAMSDDEMNIDESKHPVSAVHFNLSHISHPAAANGGVVRRKGRGFQSSAGDYVVRLYSA